MEKRAFWMLFVHVCVCGGGVGWSEDWIGVRMGVGCPCPPVRNDILTPRHWFINKNFGLKILKIQKYPKIIKRLYFKLKKKITI